MRQSYRVTRPLRRFPLQAVRVRPEVDLLPLLRPVRRPSDWPYVELVYAIALFFAGVAVGAAVVIG